MREVFSPLDADLLSDRDRPAETFATFYQRHVRWVLNLCAAQGLDPFDAGDVTAEVFASALVSRYSYGPERGDPRSWLAGIARHKVADRGRRWGREQSVCRRLGMERLVLSTEDIAEYERWRLAGEAPVFKALAELPAEQQLALRARVVSGERYESIARRLGVTELAVRQRVSRGLAALRVRLEEER